MTGSAKQTKQPDLSIIIPAYCEERRIGATLDHLADFLKHDSFFKHKDVEVIVVAADAPDRTHEIVASKQELFRRFVSLRPGPRVGKGRDVQYGMLRAQGKFVVYMDADLATPLHHLQDFYMACERGSDVVVATRNLLAYRKSSFRNVFSYIGNVLYRIAGGVPVEDTQCGFKIFRASACQLCFTRQTILGWGFDIEILAIAQSNELKVTPRRVDDWQDMPYSTYTDNAWKIAARSVRDFVHITFKRLTGAYADDTAETTEQLDQ